MKKILFLFLLFIATNAPAQYFDWNEIIVSLNNQGGWAHFDSHRVAGNGKQVVRYKVVPCLMCNVETIECFVDSNGNISGCQNNYWNGYRESYFDRFSNLIQVTKPGPHYLLKYFKSDTTIIPLNDSMPDFVDADHSKNLYLFYAVGNSTRINIYDSTGTHLNDLLLTGTQYRLSDNGEFYMCENNLLLNSAIVKKYSHAGVFIQDYTFSYFMDLSFSLPDFEIAKQSGKVFGVLNNDVVCYDSSGTLINAIPITDNKHISIALDDSENIYLWEGNQIFKYNQNIEMWHANVDASLTEKIEVDQQGNIYYICDYAEPLYDSNNGNFIPTSYYVPPALAFKGYLSDPGSNAGFDFNVVMGKISSAHVDSVNIYVAVAIQNDLPITAFCTRSIFDVRLNYDHLPVTLTEDTVYIELSDVSGSFSSAIIIGTGKGLLIPCSVPDFVPPGTGYQLRARLGDTISVSAPLSQLYAVKTAPQASIFLENSIEESYSCQPFLFKTNPNQNVTYDWFSVTDPLFAPVYNYFPMHDSSIVLPFNSYEAIGVTITNTINGCVAKSEFITPYELDPMNPLDLRMFFPDTVYVNDVPFQIQTPGYLLGHVTGNGVYEDQSANGTTYFYPDSVAPGLIPLTRTLLHSGVPCVPFSNTQYIYVNGDVRNIVMGDVEQGDQTACVGDSVLIPFTLLDSTLYDSTNTFVVELYDNDPNNSKIVKLADIGNGTASPISCVMPNFRGDFLRFRIRSTQTGEHSTLNANGNISVPVYPYVQFQENFFTTNCYPTNVPINIYSSYGEHKWFYNDTLFIDSIDWNIGTTPMQGGLYLLAVTDPDNGCIAKLGPIQVNDSAHIPSLVTDPPSYFLYSCGHLFPQITAQTDTLSSISWYYGNTILPAFSDTLLPSKAGLYKAVATCSAGCTLSIFDPKFVYADPVIKLDNPSTKALCNADSVLLSVNNDFVFFAYNYEWMKDNTTTVGTTRQVYVADSGYYNVSVSSSASGCVDTSTTIHISSSTVAVPTIAPQGIIKLYYGSGVRVSTANIPGYSYQWLRDDKLINNATKSSYYITKPGVYTLIVGNAEKCSNISLPVEVQHTHRYQHITPSTEKVAGEDNTKDVSIDIYPNPTNGQFFLNGLNIEEEGLNLTIVDLYGRSVYQEILIAVSGNINKEITPGDLAEGLYLILIKSEHHSYSMSLMVVK